MTIPSVKAGAQPRWPPWAGQFAAKLSVALIGLTTLAVLSLFFDERIALAALDVSEDAVSWGRLVSAIGESGWMFGVSAALAVGPLVMRRTRPPSRFEAAYALLTERATYILATLAASGLASQCIKHLVGRARPRLLPRFGPYSFDMLSMQNAVASFPSGHATTAFAMAVGLTLIAPTLRVPLFLLAFAIAASRIVMHAHYISDLSAGAVLGIVSALAVAHLCARRGIAFTKEGGHLRLKGPGVIAAALTGWRARP